MQRSDVLPSITAQQMREVDRLMVEELGIGLLQMMEHAGRNLVDVTRTLLGGDLRGKKSADSWCHVGSPMWVGSGWVISGSRRRSMSESAFTWTRSFLGLTSSKSRSHEVGYILLGAGRPEA